MKYIKLFLFSIFFPLTVLSNKFSELHTSIFLDILRHEIKNEKYSFIYINDEYYSTEGGTAGVAPGPPPIFHEVDSIKLLAFKTMKHDIENRYKNVLLLDSLPCNKCPIMLYAKSLILKTAQNPEYSRFIEVGLPIEGWKSLAGLSELIYFDEDHEKIVLTFPIFTLEWNRSEPQVELFSYSVTKQDGNFRFQLIKRFYLNE